MSRGIPKQCLGVLESLVGSGGWSLPLTQHFPNIVWDFATADSKHLKFVLTNAYPTSTRRNILAALVICSVVLQDDRLQRCIFGLLGVVR